MSLSIDDQVARLGGGPLTEAGLREHIWPLFSRSLARGDQVYLANHSLGRPLDQTEDDVREGLNLWYGRMDDAWDEGGWLDEMDRFRANVAKLIGLRDPTAVVPKTSAGQGIRAVLNTFSFDRPIKVTATRAEFDSVDFILKSYIEKGRVEVSWIDPTRVDQGVPQFEEEEILNKISDGADLVVLSQIVFSTGQLMPGLNAAISRAHELGALVVVDAYHSAGVITLGMEEMGADFMIGGSYKYIRGGPGACWLAIHPRNLTLQTLDTGWFAKLDPFGYSRTDRPVRSAGGDGWLESTPPVLTYYQARAGLEFTLALGVERLREFSLMQQAHLRAEFSSYGVTCFHPEDPREFGAFTLVQKPDAAQVSRSLKVLGVNTDARGNSVRFGPDVLNSLDELSRAANLVAKI